MLHSLKYAFITTVKNKNTFVWTFIFPIALSTFMFLSFGNVYKDELVMNSIPVAVEEGFEETQISVQNFLEGAKQNNGDPYFVVSVLSKEAAKEALENGDVSAIVTTEGLTPTVVVNGNDFKEEIVITAMNEYLKHQQTVIGIMSDYVKNGFVDENGEIIALGKLTPEQTEEASAAILAKLEELETDEQFFNETSLAKGPQNVYNNFFYATFAMGCLFACLGAVNLTDKLMPGRTPLSGRLNICGTSKLKMVISQMSVNLLVVFAAQMGAYFYMRLIGIELTDDILAVAGILLAGASFGISLGVLIGAIPRLGEGSKVGIGVGVTMLISFLADLCTTGIKDSIERNMPIINRISPAALISDSFMTIYVYDDYDRYFRNLITLVAMAVVITTIAIFILSRSRANKMMLKT
ncbi:MAG: ABC transporter permease [Lachnospiraceae bacterium]|nr:ABC transporter permease [Lachnospiraceae bacterium]